jgi:hypothetical protein
MKDLDFGETFAPIAHLEPIRIVLAFTESNRFKLYKMNVKSAFVSYTKKFMLGNPQVLRTPNILMECISSQKLCMGLRKCHGHGMLGLKLSC